MATLRALDKAEWDEVLKAAQELKGLGGDAVKALRRAIREAADPEPEPEPETDDRGGAILKALAWLSARETERSLRPPQVTELSPFEHEAIVTTFFAMEMGIKTWQVLASEIDVEEFIRSEADRRSGHLANLDGLTILEVLRADSFALHSFRIRETFLRWLKSCTKTEADAAVKVLRRKIDRERTERGVAAYYAVCSLRESGLSEAEAVRRVASRGVSHVSEQIENGDVYPASPFPNVEPMSVGRLRSLLDLAREYERIPRKLTRAPRPTRSKPRNP